MNLGILNTIIAMVVVLLLLSLIVQAIQGFIKKVLKLKSHEIESSLQDLYEQALSNTTMTPATPATTSGANVRASVIRWLESKGASIRKLLRLKPTGDANPPKSAAQEFTAEILAEFRDIGRSTKWGNVVLDSLSKEDLLKLMAKLDSERFVPDYVKKFAPMVTELRDLRLAIQALSKNEILTGSASAKLAEIRMVLAPLFNDVQSIVEGNEVKPRVVFGDLLRLGTIKLNGVPELLNDAQLAITQEIEVAGKGTERAATLSTLSGELAKIARLIANLSQEFDSAMAPLRTKLAQVETWYDTVMQSFDERYARHMKSVAIYVSIVVVVLLNANFFNVYRSLAKNQLQSSLIAENGEKLLAAANQAKATPTPTPTPAPAPTQTPTPTPTPTPADSNGTSPTGVTPPAAGAASPDTQRTSGEAQASPSPVASPVDIKREAEKTKEDIDLYVNMYQDFGFSPLSAEQVRAWLWSTGGWTWLWRKEASVKPNTDQSSNPGGFWGFTITRNEKGVPLTAPLELTKVENGKSVTVTGRKPITTDCREVDNDGNPLTYYPKGPQVSCSPDWRPMTGWEWWASRKNDVFGLFGWAIMVLLLSVGAPFWQDTLESLFGVKNLLRQKSGTQNIESQSGAGQPKQS